MTGDTWVLGHKVLGNMTTFMVPETPRPQAWPNPFQAGSPHHVTCDILDGASFHLRGKWAKPIPTIPGSEPEINNLECQSQLKKHWYQTDMSLLKYHRTHDHTPSLMALGITSLSGPPCSKTWSLHGTWHRFVYLSCPPCLNWTIWHVMQDMWNIAPDSRNMAGRPSHVPHDILQYNTQEQHTISTWHMRIWESKHGRQTITCGTWHMRIKT